jgi:hypothetical protein
MAGNEWLPLGHIFSSPSAEPSAHFASNFADFSATTNDPFRRNLAVRPRSSEGQQVHPSLHFAAAVLAKSRSRRLEHNVSVPIDPGDQIQRNLRPRLTECCAL